MWALLRQLSDQFGFKHVWHKPLMECCFGKAARALGDGQAMASRHQLSTALLQWSLRKIPMPQRLDVRF
jgi:hypothetical protein